VFILNSKVLWARVESQEKTFLPLKCHIKKVASGAIKSVPFSEAFFTASICSKHQTIFGAE